MSIKDLRKAISWFENNPELIYADTAATALKPTSVGIAIQQYYNYQATNPHNGDSHFTYQALEKMNECRKLCADLINANVDEIIFTSGATESLNLFAQALSNQLNANDEIILTKYEHASNLLPWYHLRDTLKVKIQFVEITDFNPTLEDFLKLITPNTKVISFTGTSNLIGLSFDIHYICAAIKKKYPHIYVCVDVAQMIPHFKCDVQKGKFDFLAFSAHKMMGPTGIGVAFVPKKLQQKINPIRFGGGMNFSINKENFCYIDGVAKYEGGTPHIAGIYGWIPALKLFQQIGYDRIKKQEQAIYDLLYSQLKDSKNITVYNWKCKSPIIAFNVNGVFCQDTANYLGKKGIIVRSGLSCAKLMNEVLPTDGVVRASFYAYNSLEEVQKFINILLDISKEKVLDELV